MPTAKSSIVLGILVPPLLGGVFFAGVLTGEIRQRNADLVQYRQQMRSMAEKLVGDQAQAWGDLKLAESQHMRLLTLDDLMKDPKLEHTPCLNLTLPKPRNGSTLYPPDWSDILDEDLRRIDKAYCREMTP